ncbi:TolC family protein [Alicyclobacillus mali]|uniref:TolC family protein n=1 Tax=Alicyclobacillus mali (ex Roth et al. 2021) TaxID=1123961 RepID=A0ABS0F1T7_9BACL|nr:TolC family protein [Alicyclobacillus mali (ex Roth et al. 2021)]MBF8377240.1 TolC family protein [Alicyclobacillus mali (ex Roth et al. 2021)]MCL6488110.1 TolC family protein [Alicyclobacillus mali (ex Roth et al. 2021)]
MEAKRSSVTGRAKPESAPPRAPRESQPVPGRTGRATDQQGVQLHDSLDEKKPSFGRRMVTMLLLIFIPLVVAAAALAAVLVVLGVPLWQDVQHWFGGKRSQPVSAQDQALRQTISIERSQIQSLESQVASLNNQLSASREHAASLQDQVKSLRAELASISNGEKQGSAEAKILAQMDPAAAAQVIEHMPASQAAWAIESLSPDASGPILQALPPATASALLQQSARDSQIAALSNATATATASP